MAESVNDAASFWKCPGGYLLVAGNEADGVAIAIAATPLQYRRLIQGREFSARGRRGRDCGGFEMGKS